MLTLFPNPFVLNGNISPKRERRRLLDAYVDKGRGECHLCRPDIAKLVEDNFRQFSGGGCGSQSRAPGSVARYELRAWMVMPNHVHVLFNVGTASMSDTVGAWKKHTDRLANKLLGKEGAFWADDYFDVFMREPNTNSKPVATSRTIRRRRSWCFIRRIGLGAARGFGISSVF